MTSLTHDLQERLQKEIKAAHEAIKTPLTPEEVAAVVRQVVQSLEGDVSAADLKFYSELEELAHYIRQAKQDIASIKPDDISTNFIPNATDELDAVVGATEDATNRIMDVCDELSALAPQCAPEINEKIVGCTTKIFEACNFQDVTGQRITKVVETLKHIDVRIEAIVKAMGDEIHRVGEGHIPKNLHAADPEKGLLNGPQLPAAAISQEDIDKLMSGEG
ncbi:MAG: protein phosphatase CheZ [Alphaproteobacteria bacterium]|nr:protein phosphatase CheZ [Alphaproteobacteria bacterium]